MLMAILLCELCQRASYIHRAGWARAGDVGNPVTHKGYLSSLPHSHTIVWCVPLFFLSFPVQRASGSLYFLSGVIFVGWMLLSVGHPYDKFIHLGFVYLFMYCMHRYSRTSCCPIHTLIRTFFEYCNAWFAQSSSP